MQTNYKFKSVDEFLNVVGRQRLQDSIQKTTNLMTRAKEEGVFPDGWVWGITAFCKEIGEEVPSNLFRSHPNAPRITEAAAD